MKSWIQSFFGGMLWCLLLKFDIRTSCRKYPAVNVLFLSFADANINIFLGNCVNQYAICCFPKGIWFISPPSLRFNLMFCDKNQNIPAKEKCVIIFVSNIYMTFLWEKICVGDHCIPGTLDQYRNYIWFEFLINISMISRILDSYWPFSLFDQYPFSPYCFWYIS